MPPRLNCAYTGAEFELVYDDELSCAGFWLRGGFDPGAGFLSEAEAREWLCRRPGGRSVKTLQCPYTGARLTIEKAHGLWWARGRMFCPRDRVARKQDLVLAASRRRGVPKYPPAVEVADGETREQHSDPRAGREPDAEFDNLVDECVDNLLGEKK